VDGRRDGRRVVQRVRLLSYTDQPRPMTDQQEEADAESVSSSASCGALEWQDEPPFEPGFYWTRIQSQSGRVGGDIASIFEAKSGEFDGEGGELMWRMYEWGPGYAKPLRLATQRQWAGPIPVPEEY